MPKNNINTHKKLPVSLCLVVLNEEKSLKLCFQNIGNVVDEILVLDTGSTDNTADVARALGAQVFSYEWDENFSNARNILLEKAHNDWVLWMDGDEYYPPELVKEIHDRITSSGGCAGYYFPRRNYYFGKWLRYGGNYPDYQLKLFKKSESSAFLSRVHEKVKLRGEAGYFKNWCEHHPYPTVDEYFRKFKYYATLDAKRLRDEGEKVSPVNTVKWLFFKPVGRFVKRYVLKGGFLNGIPGLFAAVFDAVGYIVRYIKLWELQKGDVR